MSFTWHELEHMRPKDGWHCPLPPTCAKCDYVLTGLPENRCPECGTSFKWNEVSDRASRTWRRVLRLKHANQDAATGLVMALFGWFLLGFGFLFPSPIAVLLIFVEVLLAILGLVLGSQVLNLRKVPKFARAFIAESPPSMLLGSATMVLSLGLLAGMVLFF